jgi:hypothetical protein
MAVATCHVTLFGWGDLGDLFRPPRRIHLTQAVVQTFATISVPPLSQNRVSRRAISTMASSNVDARNSTFANVTGNQLNVANIVVNRKFILLSPAALAA